MATVKLHAKETGETLPFAIARAERMIKIGGWELKDKNYTIKDGSIKRINTRKAKQTQQSSTD